MAGAHEVRLGQDEPVHRLSRRDARRIMVRAQLLDAERPDDLLDLVRHLTVLQLDPTSAIAPSADFVAWSRLGSTYRPDDLRDALDEQRLIELQQLARPREDITLYRAEMAAWPGDGLGGPLTAWQEGNRAWVEANDACRRDVLEALRQDGPLTLSELPDTVRGAVAVVRLDRRQEPAPPARLPRGPW